MATFTLTVTELQAVTRIYYVEADSRDEAVSKAEIGNTIEEEDGSHLASTEVRNRHVWDD